MHSHNIFVTISPKTTFPMDFDVILSVPSFPDMVCYSQSTKIKLCKENKNTKVLIIYSVIFYV